MSLLLPVGVLLGGLILIMKEKNIDDEAESRLQVARRHALRVISASAKGSTVVFDFDDTLIRPRNIVSHSHAGYRDVWYGDRKSLPIYEPVREMIDVCKYANARNMHIVVITARVENQTMKKIIQANANYYGIVVHEIYGYRPHIHNLQKFKAELRKDLNNQRPIILTIGDRWTDVSEPLYAHWIKLPSVDGIFRSSLDS